MYGARIVLAAVFVAASACGDGAGTVDLEDPGPLSAYPPCDPAPQARHSRVEGLVLPDAAVITGVRKSGLRLTNVRGYVPMTPIALRQFYEGRDDLEFFLIEDEVSEAEVFYSDGRRRSFVKARAVCDEGSKLFALVAPEDYGDIPIPKTSTSPTL